MDSLFKIFYKQAILEDIYQSMSPISLPYIEDLEKMEDFTTHESHDSIPSKLAKFYGNHHKHTYVSWSSSPLFSVVSLVNGS